MVKKLYFAFLLFFSFSAFSQKTYIQCGRLIDGGFNSGQKEAVLIAKSHTIAGDKAGYYTGAATAPGRYLLTNQTTMKNVTFVMKDGKIYNQ